MRPLYHSHLMNQNSPRDFFSLSSLPNRRSIELDSELSKASAESGVLPVELFGEEPSLNKLKSVVLASVLVTIDQGRGFCDTEGDGFSFKSLGASTVSSTWKLMT